MTDDELRAAAYFAVGVTSEGSIAGRDVSYRLSFAGNVRNGVMDPVGNSGYSFGTLQIDLGQHPDVARQMLDSYQRWAATQPAEAQRAHARRVAPRPQVGDPFLASRRVGRTHQ